MSSQSLKEIIKHTWENYRMISDDGTIAKNEIKKFAITTL